MIICITDSLCCTPKTKQDCKLNIFQFKYNKKKNTHTKKTHSTAVKYLFTFITVSVIKKTANKKC